MKGNKFLSYAFNAHISDKNPRVKYKILRKNLKKFLKTSLQIINLSIGRIGYVSFTVHTNIRDLKKKNKKWLISLFGKRKTAEKLQTSKNVSTRAKQDLRELEEMLKQLDSMIENGVKWSRV